MRGEEEAAACEALSAALKLFEAFDMQLSQLMPDSEETAFPCEPLAHEVRRCLPLSLSLSLCLSLYIYIYEKKT